MESCPDEDGMKLIDTLLHDLALNPHGDVSTLELAGGFEEPETPSLLTNHPNWPQLSANNMEDLDSKLQCMSHHDISALLVTYIW